MKSTTILVTGAAGFIGMHVAQRLLGQGHCVVGVDCLNQYYSVELKRARLRQLAQLDGFEFRQLDLVDRGATASLFRDGQFSRVVHLAAQAGVRYAAENPAAYIDSNLTAFGNVLEGCRRFGCGHLLFASSSSVYGGNAKSPFDESDPVDHPMSLYAATKRSNELMAHSYSHLFQLPTTGVRFFTVYGPWGRPDMALSLFASALIAGRSLKVFNEGKMSRDYTFVGDAADGVVKLLAQPPEAIGKKDAASTDRVIGPDVSETGPFRLYNIGNHRPIRLLELIEKLASAMGKRPHIELLPMQPGDVVHTCADMDTLTEATGFAPRTSIDEGLRQFVEWYLDYNAHQWT